MSGHDPTTAASSDSAPPSGPPDEDAAAELRRSRWRATALLGLAVVIFVLARANRGPGWLGYVEAAAEAALIGGLADWFAVTALFRHPLGLPIPHTAILPTRKAALGRSLAEFVQTNFLGDEVIAERLAERDLIGRAGAWLIEDDHADQVVDRLARTAASTVRSAGDELVGPELGRIVERRLRQVPVAPVAARAVEAALVDGRVDRLVDRFCAFAVRFAEQNRPYLRARLGEESPRWVPDFIDDRVYRRFEQGLANFTDEIRQDPEHPFRAQLAERLSWLIVDLDEGGPAAEQLNALWHEVLDLPEVGEWVTTLWGAGRDELAAVLSDPDAPLRQRAALELRALGSRLVAEQELRDRVAQGLARVVDQTLEVARAELGDLIVTTVDRWDGDDASTRIELAVGRDLQFIRINGTLVGAVLGLLIHGLGELVFG